METGGPAGVERVVPAVFEVTDMIFHPRRLGRLAGSLLAAWVAAIAASSPACAQADRETALAALRSAATAGDVDAQLALGNLLDQGRTERDDEALRWYESAARAGNRIAQRRYLSMMAKPPRQVSAMSAGFMVRLPRHGMQGAVDDMPPELPPGYHCHVLGSSQMWCHGGTDPSR